MSNSERSDDNKILQSTLEDVVAVNSLFTLAVFLGISFASPNQRSLETHRPGCDPDAKMGKRLVVCEVVSFSCFLLSSLVAKSLKVCLTVASGTAEKPQVPGSAPPEANPSGSGSSNSTGKIPLFSILKKTMFGMAMFSSTLGVLFLTISMAYVIEIKIGRLSCGIPEAQAAIMALSTLVAFGLLVYLPCMSAATYRA